ncbi:MAG: hypothetical protein IT379_21795 [Deltaproteobacteria bacterium]|nr:hypothetical protein [Deltaproteobacteria bacterium]
MGRCRATTTTARVAVAILAAAGCDDARTATCGTGEVVSADGHRYCAFGPDLVASGRADCPDAIPVRIAVGASVVCADRALDPEDVPSAVCDAIGGCGEPADAGAGPDGGEGGDGGSSPVDASSDEDAGDAAAPPSSGFVQIEAGTRFTCARTSDGDVVCWGANDSGQLGVERGPEGLPLLPTLVTGLPEPAIDLACGVSHACAVARSGSVWCWGSNVTGRVNPSSAELVVRPVRVAGVVGAVEVAAAESSSCARLGDGTVTCWGDSPYVLTDSRDVTPVAGLADVVEIDAGYGHVCARTRSGDVLCWGTNVFGQLGDGTMRENSDTPVAVVGITRAEGIAVGSAHGCAVTGGQVDCWGSGDYGQLGIEPVSPSGTTARVPVRVPGVRDVLEVAAGGPDLSTGHTCVRLASQILCFGDARNQQTGGPGTAMQWMPWPVPLAATHLALGGVHSCALAGDGVAYCWGRGDDLQLGVVLLDGYATPAPQRVGSP